MKAPDSLPGNLGQGVHDGADAERIEADGSQLAALIDLLGQGRDLGDVVAQVGDDPQFASGFKVAEHRGLALAPIEHRTVGPRPRPQQPVPGDPVSTEYCEAQQIVQAAAVDADHHHLAPLEQGVQGERPVGGPLPEIGANPAIGAKREADFYVQVLRRPADDLALAFGPRLRPVVFQPLDRHRPVPVRRHHPPVAGILPGRRIGRVVGDVLRELVEHRQHGSLGLTVPDATRHHQL
ncbi:MAG: hypothetical protein HQ465_13045, partial [Rhodospirillales bacterium]|nr:hypothetical protein [Rhodospirillales bacterium]